MNPLTGIIVSIIIFCVPLIAAIILNILIDHGVILQDLDYSGRKEDKK